MLQGFILGLSLILPIGAQNVFILTQARTLGLLKALFPALIAACSDMTLIMLGYLGASQFINRYIWVKIIFLIIGIIILLYLGYSPLTARPQIDLPTMSDNLHMSLFPLLGKTLAVSLLNPHAIIDTVGIIGGNIATIPVSQQGSFVLGCMLASFAWFIFLTLFPR